MMTWPEDVYKFESKICLSSVALAANATNETQPLEQINTLLINKIVGLLESLKRLIWLHSEDQYGPASSEEEARTKLADYTTLLKNMDFQIVAKDKF